VLKLLKCRRPQSGNEKRKRETAIEAATRKGKCSEESKVKVEGQKAERPKGKSAKAKVKKVTIGAGLGGRDSTFGGRFFARVPVFLGMGLALGLRKLLFDLEDCA
jgi:hypothetical protein